jgi:flagellar biosynthesis/type III secretory pathway chaperone
LGEGELKLVCSDVLSRINKLLKVKITLYNNFEILEQITHITLGIRKTFMPYDIKPKSQATDNSLKGKLDELASVQNLLRHSNLFAGLAASQTCQTVNSFHTDCISQTNLN